MHTGSAAARASRRLGARAFSTGTDIGFASGEYAPQTARGQRLLAHELSHVALHSGTGKIHLDRYSSSERAAMARGTVSGGALDTAVASEQGFKPGDIVFRLGSTGLAGIIGEAVTHGGIFLGSGLIHDMVGFGNRTVRLTDFYLEAADPSVIRIVRFTGPHSGLILHRLLANVGARNFRLPTDPKPWNLVSSATDYGTATCLEYSHAQFLHAINQLAADTTVDAAIRAALRSEYFASGAATASDLVQPHAITQSGTPQAPPGFMVGAMIGAADYLAEDVDPTVFENRWEGTTTTTDHGPWWAPNLVTTATLQTFTYRSFVDSRRYFTEFSTPGVSARTTPNSQVLVDASNAESDAEIRDFVSGSTASTLGGLPVAEKVRMIVRLLEGWIDDTDVQAVESLCSSVTSSAEMSIIDTRVRPLIEDMYSSGQRARVRSAIGRRP